ncbi:hypothetical protein DRN86_03265 [Candidatus Geothermarchaeota archaeon]|nr:MAG: hypothetical protein DRN86_03265 [Candidatus Geothermarchaeota archaeon]
MSTGAKPFALVNVICNEPHPTGQGILNGIISELEETGLRDRVRITGHFEKNVTTVQTSVGITVLGLVKKQEFKVGSAKSGDLLVAIGKPLVGDEVVRAIKDKADRKLIADLGDITNLLKSKSVHEVIPVGSRGIAAEAIVIAKDSKLSAEFFKREKIDLKKSAGPSTVILTAIDPSGLPDVKELIKKPVTVVGRLI